MSNSIILGLCIINSILCFVTFGLCLELHACMSCLSVFCSFMTPCLWLSCTLLYAVVVYYVMLFVVELPSPFTRVVCKFLHVVEFWFLYEQCDNVHAWKLTFGDFSAHPGDIGDVDAYACGGPFTPITKFLTGFKGSVNRPSRSCLCLGYLRLLCRRSKFLGWSYI